VPDEEYLSLEPTYVKALTVGRHLVTASSGEGAR
jgi:hypothetical protein